MNFLHRFNKNIFNPSTWWSKWQYISTIFLSIVVYIYLAFLRNEWYGNFYTLIGKHSMIGPSVVYFLTIAALVVLNDFFKGWIKIKYITSKRILAQNFTQERLMAQNKDSIKNSSKDFSQRFCEDQRLQAENFINALDSWLVAISTIAFFLPRIFFIIGTNMGMIIALLIAHTGVIFAFNFGFVKSRLQAKLNVFEENEARLRNFVSTWINNYTVNPSPFSNTTLADAKMGMNKYYIFRLIVEAIRNMYEYFGLIIPFVIFYSIYAAHKIDFGTLIKLINIWTMLNFSIITIAKGIEQYISSNTSKNRLTLSKNARIYSEKIIIKNVNIIIHGKIIISDFSLEIIIGDHVNIIGKNTSGKTTLMQAMQGIITYDGIIELPANTLFIPEQPILTQNFYNDMDSRITPQFVKNCQELELDITNKTIEKLSGAEKWKTIAAYSMCFDVVIWDDPFWGLNTHEYMQKILPKMKTVIVFSQYPIANMKIKQLVL